MKKRVKEQDLLDRLDDLTYISNKERIVKAEMLRLNNEKNILDLQLKELSTELINLKQEKNNITCKSINMDIRKRKLANRK